MIQPATRFSVHSRKLTRKPKKGPIKTTAPPKGGYMGFHVSFFLRLTPLNVKEGLRPLHRLIAAGFHFCKASRREHTGVGKGLPKVVVSHLVVLIVVSFTLPAFPKGSLVPCSSKSAVGPSNPIEDFFVEDPAGSLESTVPHPVPENSRRALGLGLSLVAYPQPSLIGKSSPLE